MPKTSTVEHSGLAELHALLNGGKLITEEAELEYFSHDYFNRGPEPEAVFQPSSVEELAGLVAAASARGLAIYPRGGGFSYTDGYLLTKPGISIDMRSMDRVIEINEEDMYVTVEAGCTWAQLDEALAPRGLRTPFWGPMSGRNATIGGGASQGAVSFGSAKYGISADTIIGMTVVSVDGRIIQTGSAGQPNHSPFFRNYGPDLTGLFCGDCGALGIKATVSLKLIKRPKSVLGLSFGFVDYESYFKASARVAREGLATESIGTLSETVEERAKSEGLVGGIKALGKVISASPSLGTGLARATKMALAGANFAKNHQLLLHLVVEGHDDAMVNSQAARIREVVGDLGQEIANTVPTMLRAEPFPSYDMLSVTGQRQLPPSVILPFSKVIEFHHDLEQRIAARKEQIEALGVSVIPVFATIGTGAFLYEIVMAWDDNVDEFHRRHTNPDLVAKVEHREPAPAARQLAADLRSDLVEAGYLFGGVHVQIGKVYPYDRERNTEALSLLKSLKQELDPRGLCNPGALGLALVD
ncbi:FAD-binding oxidoreductase [Altererythrobacter sp. GH1-8]|uniref:FAD-binding oxidoreductase n=1 Tax=Altererythrobacter sp. GH1-8 TaxID=3349333 RepID=UPI00374D9D6C